MYTWSPDWTAVAAAFTASLPNVLGAYMFGYCMAIPARWLWSLAFGR